MSREGVAVPGRAARGERLEERPAVAELRRGGVGDAATATVARVTGTSVIRYVETLASLLTGEGVEYRHADAADFDTELDMERRIKEAGAG